MKVVAFLPVKRDSGRVENKNIKVLSGKPLFIHTLEKLAACEFIDEVHLDSESDEIFEMAKGIKFTPLKRDASLADNRTDGHKLFYNEVSQVKGDIYIQILCTSPFIKPETIQKGIDILRKEERYDSVVLVKKDKQYLWEKNQPAYDKFNIPNSFDLEDTTIETMGLYIVRGKTAHEKRMRFGDNVFLLEAEPIEAIDVNYPADFQLAETIARGLKDQENRMLRSLSNVFTSPMLSDILDDLNLSGFIGGMQLNIAGKRIFGRARTLKIRKLHKDENYKGIYDALESYESVTSNDVIMVENECGEFAYFGDLNANLAIRAGAIATIVDGKTRDFNKVLDLDYPVFSKGYSSRDVRKRATLDYMNKPIIIGGVTVCPDDLIFGDNDGIVVIPKSIEMKVISMAIEIISKESQVVSKVVRNYHPLTILNEVGEF